MLSDDASNRGVDPDFAVTTVRWMNGIPRYGREKLVRGPLLDGRERV